MRYFLVTIADQNLKSNLRDLRRKLGRFKRNLIFRDPDNYYFTLKYLGQNFTPAELAEIQDTLNEFVKTAKVPSFRYSLDKLRMGEKSELDPMVIYLQLKPSPELNEFLKLVHRVSLKSGLETIVRKKDHNRLLGICKIAQVRNSTNRAQLEEIKKIVFEYPVAKELVIDNLAIISTELDRNKQVSTKIAQIPLQ